MPYIPRMIVRAIRINGIVRLVDSVIRVSRFMQLFVSLSYIWWLCSFRDGVPGRWHVREVRGALSSPRKLRNKEH